MTDDQQNQPATNQSTQDDPLASLEEILAKTKAKRQPQQALGEQVASDGTGDIPTQQEQASEPQLSPEEMNAQRQQEIAAMEKIAEQERQEKVEEQKQKMQQMLEGSPEVQARMEQQETHAKEEEERKAKEQGHVIHQIQNDKV